MKPVLENLKIIGDKILVDIKNMATGGDIQKVEEEISAARTNIGGTHHQKTSKVSNIVK